jgi:lysophospholipase L1-like esterase
MKPFRIFIFYAAVLLILLGISIAIPEEGLRINGSMELSFLHFPDLFNSRAPVSEVNVEELLARSMVTSDPESDPVMRHSLPSDGIQLSSKPLPDISRSTGAVSSRPSLAAARANVDSLQKSVFRIQFPGGSRRLLDPFFQSLEDVGSGRNTYSRILHFGDSQIENDRMTGLIRYRLQKMVGGSGTGLVQAIPLYSGSMAYKQDQEGEWLRYTYFGKRDTSITHRSYGIMGAFTSVPIPEEGKIPMLNYRFNTSRRSGQCDRVRMFIHSYADGGSVLFEVNDSIVDSLIYVEGGFSEVDLSHRSQVKDLKIYLNLPEGGRIYGISFESHEGVHMDNIAMRGSSGLVFSKMNKEQQKKMMDRLSPEMIILQFGGNVVHYMRPSYYREFFKKELDFFKELVPGIPIVVIGPADMSIREKGVFLTYPQLEPIRDALRQATLESGFGFWDLYEAMGGSNSMPSFVHADPPLASKDYLHFTPKGANLVAEMFYNALMLEYNHFSAQYSNN